VGREKPVLIKILAPLLEVHSFFRTFEEVPELPRPNPYIGNFRALQRVFSPSKE
jgi:hypothetical protein